MQVGLTEDMCRFYATGDCQLAQSLKNHMVDLNTIKHALPLAVFPIETSPRLIKGCLSLNC